MKNNKGITLVSLILYIILAIMILGMLTVLTSNFRNNVDYMDTDTMQQTEFDKLNLQLLKEIKTENNYIKEDESTSTKIVFASNNSYTYIEDEKSVYLNDNIKIAAGVTTFNCAITRENNKQKLTVTVEIAGTEKTFEYVVGKKLAQAGIMCLENQVYIYNKKAAIIPAGFTVSGVSTEQTIDDGLVIYLIPDGETVDWTDGAAVATAQQSYDQFVWIPIKSTTDANEQDINDMYICQGKTADNGVCTIKVKNRNSNLYKCKP